ncbi:MAG TPA: PAS domain S-box protein [Puia sp.]|nr:PAS domain S-box protein [Puia sp.]
MNKPIRILFLDDNDNDAEIIQDLLSKAKLNYESRQTINKDSYQAALEEFHPDIILSDHALPQFDSVEALAMARQRYPSIPFIVVTGTVSEEFAAGILRSGADDYILKDRLNRLPATIENVLHLRQSEQEKRDAAEKYRTIFLKSPFPNWIYDCETLHFLDVNDAAVLQYGYSREEFLKMTIRDIRPKEDLERLLAYIKTIGADSDSGQGIWRHIKKNGQAITVETTSYTIGFDNRRSRMVIAHDVTDHIEAEEKRIQSEINLKTIFENTSEGFLLMDRNGVIRAFNKKAGNYALFSKEKDVQIGQSIYDCIEEPRKEFFEGIIKKALDGENIQYDRAYDMGGGNTAWIDFSVTPVIEADEVSGICITGRNITDKKILEKKMLEQNIQEQKKIARAIITAQEKERNRLGQELHDNINQLLASIKLYLGMAKNEATLKELISYPMELTDTAMNEIRVLSSKLVTPPKNIKLKDLIQAILYDLDKNMAIKTAFMYDLDNQAISNDLKLNIYRIIQEQLNNIVKHAQAKKITISVQMQKSMIYIAVSDDGIGYDVGKKRKGIGISNMMNRVQSFNGEVEIKSTPGNGCTVEIRIPY